MFLSSPDQDVRTTGPSLTAAFWDGAYELPCQQSSQIDLWFAEGAADVERAKSLCAACPLRHECLQGAIAREEPWGVWGGEAFVDGRIVAQKRGRGRPPKKSTTTEAA